MPVIGVLTSCATPAAIMPSDGQALLLFELALHRHPLGDVVDHQHDGSAARRGEGRHAGLDRPLATAPVDDAELDRSVVGVGDAIERQQVEERLRLMASGSAPASAAKARFADTIRPSWSSTAIPAGDASMMLSV